MGGALSGATTIAMGGALSGATTIAGSGLASLGSLAVDDNSTIGCDSDTDLMTIGAAALTLKGTLTVGVDGTGHDTKLFGDTAGSFLLWDQSADALLLTDSTPIQIGDGQDLTLYHDGSNSYITYAIGALKLATETSGIAVTIGHSTSEVTVADNFSVTGDAAVTGTLSMAADLVHTGDINNKIAFGTDTQSFETGGTARINLSDTGLQIGDGTRVTTILDEDAMGTNSATALATQQSIKAYVDSQAFTPDMWVQVATGTTSAGSAFTISGSEVNGSTSSATFTTSTTLNAIQIFVNGQLQYIGAGKDVTISGTKELTFTYDVLVDDVIVIHHFGD